jgi:hypothetical protein
MVSMSVFCAHVAPPLARRTGGTLRNTLALPFSSNLTVGLQILEMRRRRSERQLLTTQ